MSSVPKLAEQLWFPCYPDRIFASGKWQAMKDYQRGWYWHLILLMTRSKPLGYLPLDGRLWALAGACSKQYWDNHSALVLSAFKAAEFDGQSWIYSEPLLKVLNEQQHKHDQAVANGRVGGHIKRSRSRPSCSYSFEFEKIWESNSWKCVSKQTAFRALEKALGVIQKEKQKTRDEAIEFLAGAMEEFKISPAGRDHGLHEQYTAPYPASWLNAGRWDDDRRTWHPGAGGRTNLAGAANGTNGTAATPRSLAKEGCTKCGGSGWDTSTGKAIRCECWTKNRKSNAASGGTA